MLRFIGRRVATASIAVIGVVTVIFVLARLIGDPVALMMQPGMTPADVTALRHALHVDEPLAMQYAGFVSGALHGDFGISPWQGQSAFRLVAERLPATLLLTSAALGFATVFALTLGTLAVAYPGSWLERLCGSVSLAGQSMPNFWLALMLVLLFSTTLHWLPPAGYGAPVNLVMPALSLGLFTMARLMRLVQSELTAAMREDYVRTARAKGLAELRVLLRHALRNAAMPLVTVLAVDFTAMMGGAVVTESVFAWPGVGLLMIQAIGQRDFPILQASAFVIALIVVVTTLLADIAYVALIRRCGMGERPVAMLGVASLPKTRRAGPRWRMPRYSVPTVLAAAFLLLLIAMALTAPWVAPFDPLAGDVLANLLPPSLQGDGGPAHLLGTDMLGRDVLSGIIYGARISLIVGITSVIGAGLVGSVIGIACGYCRGLLDEVLMRLVDIQLAFPFVLLAIIIMFVLGQGLGNVITVLVVATWPIYARVARAEAMRLREMEFIQATRALGAGHLRIVFRHIVPNALSPLIVVATTAVPQMIIFEAALSFLGIGLPPTEISWGSLLAAGRDYLDQAWWIATLPGIAIMLTILSINVLGNRLRQRLDPRGRLNRA